MNQLADLISKIRTDFARALTAAKSLREFEEVRHQFLGKRGVISELVSRVKELTLDEKKLYGPQINLLRTEAEAQIEAAHERIIKEHAATEQIQQQQFDVTAYLPHAPHGHLHPYEHFIEEIENIFISMGYEVFDGPEVETDFYNFTALNIPANHPARDMYDTLWLNRPHLLLRTHTSPAQIHAMRQHPLPLAGIVTGRCFRHEAVDASHDVMFMQCEGIVIDKHISLSHLFGTAKTFLSTLFETKNLDIRIRPGFFPFVEPGVEIDMRCIFCSDGCSVCKKSTWIEIFPAGMIHPNVLQACDIDPAVYRGFAFGFGLTRLAMLKYGINDIRAFHSGKMSFLSQL